METKQQLIKTLKLGLLLFEKDKSVGIGAGSFRSKIIDWPKYWEMVGEAISDSQRKKLAVK